MKQTLSLALIAIFIVLSGIAVAIPNPGTGETRSVIPWSNLSDCANATVWINTSLADGEYQLIGCTKVEPNKWFCEITPGSDILMVTQASPIDNYNLSYKCDVVNSLPVGTPTDIEVCDGSWTACAGDLSYRYCYQGLLNTTKVKNCTTGAICSPNWKCADWSSCYKGSQQKSCTELNQCWTAGTVLNKSCACAESWGCANWGACVDGSQQRSCSDANNCGTTISKPAESQSCVCAENWECGAWGDCIEGTKTRSCADTNSCGTTANRPSLSGSCTVACVESWQCSDWGSCTDGTHTRNCTDSNSCGTISSKPGVSQSCSISCAENWQCTDWGICRSDSKQIRACADASNCGTAASKPAESQSCTYTGGNGGGGSGGGSHESGNGGSDTGWICEPYGPCINGKKTAFCYRDNRSRGMNYTVSEKCVEEKINVSVPDINWTEPIIVPPAENATGNQTEPPKKGPAGITGLFGALLPKQPWQWALLILILLALAGYGIYRLLKGKEIAAAGKKKKKGKK